MYELETCVDLDIEMLNSSVYTNMVMETYKTRFYDKIKINLDRNLLFDENLYEQAEKVFNILEHNKISPRKAFFCVSTRPGTKMIYDKKEWEQVIKFYNYLLDNKCNLVFEDVQSLWSVQEVENANMKLHRVVNFIKHNSYSPLENLMSIYLKVTSKQYKYNRNVLGQTRYYAHSIYGVLNSNQIVCVGYCELIKEMLKQLGEKNITVYDNFIDGPNGTGHMNLIIKIKDEKYGINGYYYLDPTWDSADGNQKTSLNFFLMPLGELKTVKAFETFPSLNDLSYTTHGLFFGVDFLDEYLKEHPEQEKQVMQSFVQTFYDEKIKDYSEKLETMNVIKELCPHIIFDYFDEMDNFISKVNDISDPKKIKSKINPEQYKQKSLKIANNYYKQVLGDFKKYLKKKCKNITLSDNIINCMKRLQQDQEFVIKYYNFDALKSDELHEFLMNQFDCVIKNLKTIDELYDAIKNTVKETKLQRIENLKFDIKKLTNKYSSRLEVYTKEKQLYQGENAVFNENRYNNHFVYNYGKVNKYKNDFIEEQILQTSKPISINKLKQALTKILDYEYSFDKKVVDEYVDNIVDNTKTTNIELYQDIPSRYDEDEITK